MASQGQNDFDLVVVGGGPGGYAAALHAAGSGLEVALVDEGRLGGTCLHRGCIPAKHLLQTAEMWKAVGSAENFGVELAAPPTLDMATSQSRSQNVIDQLESGLSSLLASRDVTVLRARAELDDAPGRVIIDAGVVTAKSVILATGSRPRSIPHVPFDGQQVLSSDDVVAMTELPQRTLVIGGGAIGCEFASFLSDVGSNVTIIEQLPQLLPGLDRDAARIVERSFRDRGVTTRVGADFRDAAIGQAVDVAYTDDRGDHTVTVDSIIVSIGRSPNTDRLGLDRRGVATSADGFIDVDRHMRTNVEDVYAIGDVVATPQLAHVAFSEARVAVSTIVGDDVAPVEYSKVPWAIYCRPEVAFCGLTESDARQQGLDVDVAVHRFAGNGRALITGDAEGFVKLVSVRSGAIVGVHIVGPMATELLAEGYLAVNWEATPGDLSPLAHAHPSFSEAFGEAALVLAGQGLHGVGKPRRTATAY